MAPEHLDEVGIVIAHRIGDPPTPSGATTIEQLIQRLRLLQAWSGMSYRSIHRELVRARAIRGVPERPVLNTVYRCFQPGRVRLDIDLVVEIANLLLGDEATAEEWRRACWVAAGLGSAAAVVNVADTWPVDLPSFTGRHLDLQKIVQPEKGQRPELTIWAISGMPGVGKTRLAVRAGHLLMSRGLFTRLQLAVDLRGHDPDQPPVDSNAVLEGFLRKLGMSGSQIQHLSMVERTAKFRELLAGRNALLLLDNAASAEQVQPLLPAGPGCFVMITSRRILSNLLPARHFPLDVLTRDEAVSVLRRALDDVTADPELNTIADLANLLGRLPLALELVVNRIRASPDWTLTDHLERHRYHRSSLRLDNEVEAAITLSYRDLPADQQCAFRLLALHPGGDITPHAAAALIGTDLDAAGCRLEQLTAASLLQRPKPGKYRFHEIIHTYAIGRALEEDAAGARRASLARLFDRLSTHRVSDKWMQSDGVSLTNHGRTHTAQRGRGWLDFERANPPSST